VEDIEKYNNSLALSINKIWDGFIGVCEHKVMRWFLSKVGLCSNIVPRHNLSALITRH